MVNGGEAALKIGKDVEQLEEEPFVLGTKASRTGESRGRSNPASREPFKPGHRRTLMTTLERINILMQAHDCHASAPTVISPLSTPFDLDFPGILIVGTSVDVFSRDIAGAPHDDLYCCSTDNVSEVLNGIVESRRSNGTSTVAMAARAAKQVRVAIGEDLAAEIHMHYKGEL